MSGKILFNVSSPVTQKPEAVVALAAYLNKPIEAGVLDLGSTKLVKSNKGDAFYTVTAKACSCPAATYHHGPCKHQRRYFPQPKREADIRASLPGWRGPDGQRANGPVEA